MPRTPTEYTRAVIYKIVCRDPAVTQAYVGSTTNLVNRRACHKKKCNSPKAYHYNHFVYRFIRDHGGFDNWDIVLVEENIVGCSGSQTLHARERYWIETLHAELNTTIPTRTQKEWRADNKLLYKDTEKVRHKRYREHNQDKIIKYNEKRRKLYAMEKDRDTWQP